MRLPSTRQRARLSLSRHETHVMSPTTLSTHTHTRTRIPHHATSSTLSLTKFNNNLAHGIRVPRTPPATSTEIRRTANLA